MCPLSDKKQITYNKQYYKFLLNQYTKNFLEYSLMWLFEKYSMERNTCSIIFEGEVK